MEEKGKITKLTTEQLKGIRQPRFKPCSHGHHEVCVAAHDMFICGCDCHRPSGTMEVDIGGEG